MNQAEFLIQHLTEGKSYKTISEENGIHNSQLSQWWESGLELRSLIKKSNQLYSNKKNTEEFSEFRNLGKRAFFEWYRAQPRKCAYCGIEETKLEKLFDKETGILGTKRGRGRTLELERRNTVTNEYSKENCVLACYLCNNHKSDLITEEEHLEYFAPAIRKFLEDKFNNLNDNR
jgi:hypothetical protein